MLVCPVVKLLITKVRKLNRLSLLLKSLKSLLKRLKKRLVLEPAHNAIKFCKSLWNGMKVSLKVKKLQCSKTSVQYSSENQEIELRSSQQPFLAENQRMIAVKKKVM